MTSKTTSSTTPGAATEKKYLVTVRAVEIAETEDDAITTFCDSFCDGMLNNQITVREAPDLEETKEDGHYPDDYSPTWQKALEESSLTDSQVVERLRQEVKECQALREDYLSRSTEELDNEWITADEILHRIGGLEFALKLLTADTKSKSSGEEKSP